MGSSSSSATTPDPYSASEERTVDALLSPGTFNAATEVRTLLTLDEDVNGQLTAPQSDSNSTKEATPLGAHSFLSCAVVPADGDVRRHIV